ncbi:OmpA family protein [Reyranella sp.]|uniref:OmpA family protein n=1 Tax=Reyranella sp. TaxID=1929291 RepID=UPI003D122D3E
MKKSVYVAGALLLLPSISAAQDFNPQPGFYVGAGAGFENYLNSTSSVGGSITGGIGFGLGALIGGYDFVGPRVELEVAYGQAPITANLPNGTFYATGRQLQFMGKVLYDFFPAATFTPYVGAGAGLALVSTSGAFDSAQFAYQGLVGGAWNIDSQWRIFLEGRYIGTTSPTVNVAGVSVTAPNNNIVAIIGGQYKFAPPAAAPPPPPPPAAAAPSFMVFFDWDRSNLSAQALNTIRQAAGAYKTKGSARITATGHTDTSGPENYNMALSLRRANTVKDALVREGVPATAIAVIGRGEAGLLVQTADGVREPQNRRVEIVIQ